MKRFILLVISFASVAAFTTACSSSAGIDDQSPEAFATTITQPGVVILDVRTPAEFNAGHIFGAINIDVEDPAFASNIAKLDKTADYAVYCRSGNRSSIAANQMKDAGFTSLTTLSGGLLSWNGPLVVG